MYCMYEKCELIPSTLFRNMNNVSLDSEQLGEQTGEVCMYVCMYRYFEKINIVTYDNIYQFVHTL